MGPLVSPVAAAGQHTGDFCASDTSPHSRPTSSRMSLDLAVPLPATSGGPSTRQSLDSFLQAHAANSRSMAGQRPGLQQSVTAGSPSLKETVVSLRRESSETGRVSDYPVKASNRVHWGMELHQKSRGSMSSRGVVSSRGARDGRRSLDLSATSRTAGSPMPRHPGRAVTAGSSCPMRKSLDNSSLLASSSSYHLSWGTVDSVPQAQGTASTMMPRSEKSCPSLNGLSMTSEPLLSNEPASTMAVRSGRSCYSLKVLHATQAPSASHDSMRLRSAKVSATTSSTLVSSELVGSYAAGKVQTAITRAKPSTSFLG